MAAKRAKTASKTKNKKEENTKGQKEQIPESAFPIVGIGASAGGLQALETSFAKLPADCNMAFVIVQHLDPHHESLMNSLLSKETPLGVNDIRDGVSIEPNQVYIKPPGKDVVIQDRTLYLREAKEKQGIRLPIDTFFRSLAEDQKEKAICIIMSGASNDGTLGAQLIKGEGGLVMVQEEQQAQYSLDAQKCHRCWTGRYDPAGGENAGATNAIDRPAVYGPETARSRQRKIRKGNPRDLNARANPYRP